MPETASTVHLQRRLSTTEPVAVLEGQLHDSLPAQRPTTAVYQTVTINGEVVGLCPGLDSLMPHATFEQQECRHQIVAGILQHSQLRVMHCLWHGHPSRRSGRIDSMAGAPLRKSIAQCDCLASVLLALQDLVAVQLIGRQLGGR